MENKQLHPDVSEILLSQEQLEQRVAQIGAEITRDFAGRSPLFVFFLNFFFFFMSYLMRHVDLPCSIDFMAVSSYGSGTKTTGAVKIIKDLNQDIEGKDVILVEDILDSGVTLHYLTEYLSVRKPATITIATLMDKPSRRKAPVYARYSGFEIPDAFVVGYGLDYDERYRNLPYIGILKESVYS